VSFTRAACERRVVKIDHAGLPQVPGDSCTPTSAAPAMLNLVHRENERGKQ
jgi:hypothetical protein